MPSMGILLRASTKSTYFLGVSFDWPVFNFGKMVKSLNKAKCRWSEMAVPFISQNVLHINILASCIKKIHILPSITDGVHCNENFVEIIPVFSTFSNFFKKKKKKL